MSADMTHAMRTALIAEAVAQHDALEKAWAPLIAAVRNHDFPAQEASWRVYDAYLRTLSARIGDDFGGWMSWFVFENKGGRAGLKAKAAAWSKPRPIRTARDLARLIEADLQNV